MIFYQGILRFVYFCNLTAGSTGDFSQRKRNQKPEDRDETGPVVGLGESLGDHGVNDHRQHGPGSNSRRSRNDARRKRTEERVSRKRRKAAGYRNRRPDSENIIRGSSRLSHTGRTRPPFGKIRQEYGRKRLFELPTITFEEFINHRTDYRYEDNLADFLAIEKDRTQQLLSEYMNFGGYPRIVMAAEEREKRQLIDEIFRSVLEKDIVYLLKLDKPEVFSALIKILAGQVGQLVNYSEMASTLNVSFATVKKYLW